MTDKPLHVRVAEALGAKPFWSTREQWECKCKDPDGCLHRYEPSEELLRYDTDWSATGPLIEKYVRFLEKVNDSGPVAWGARSWDSDDDFSEMLGNGPTPLVAVCHLILELAKAGTLKP